MSFTKAGLIRTGYGGYAPHILRGALEGVARDAFEATDLDVLIASFLTSPVPSADEDGPTAGAFRAVVLALNEEPADGEVVTRRNGTWTSEPPVVAGSFRGAWAANTAYSARDLVIAPATAPAKLRGRLLTAKSDFTSAAAFSAADWTVAEHDETFAGPWQPNTDYEAGQVVSYLNQLYSANADFTSASTFNPASWTGLAGVSVLRNGSPVAAPNFLDVSAADMVALGLSYGLAATDVITGPGNHQAGINEFSVLDATGGSFTTLLPSNSAVVGALWGAGLIAQAGNAQATLQAGPGDTFDRPGGPTTKTLKVAGQRILCLYRPAVQVWTVLLHSVSLDATDARYAPIGAAGATDYGAPPVGETYTRGLATNTSAGNSLPPTSGSMRYTRGSGPGKGVVLAGKTLAHLTVSSGATAGAGITHAWMAVYKVSDGTLISVTNDLPAAIVGGAWPANTDITFDLVNPYTAAADTPVWVGIVIVQAGGAMPNLVTINLPSQINGMPAAAGAPVLAADTGVGLTDPASRPAAVPVPGVAAVKQPVYVAFS